MHHFRASLVMLFEWLPACLLQILLDANTIQLGSLPLGIYTASPSQASLEQAVYEVCVCPSGKIYLSPAESSSTCQAMSNICLWSWPGSSIGDRGQPLTSAPEQPRWRLLRWYTDGEQNSPGWRWSSDSSLSELFEFRLVQSLIAAVVYWRSGLTTDSGRAALKSGIPHTNKNISTTLY